MEPLSSFFQRYLAAWNSPAEQAALYNEPCLVVQEGKVHLSRTREEMGRFLSEGLEKDRARGFAKAVVVAIDNVPVGSLSSLATVRWSCLNARDQKLFERSVSYNLHPAGNAWKIVLQTLREP